MAWHERNAMSSLLDTHKAAAPEFRLGNLLGIDKHGNEYGKENFLSDAYNISLTHKNEYKHAALLKAQYEYSDQRISVRIKDRITLREDMQANVRPESRTRSDELPPPGNFPSGSKFTVLREIKWSEDEVHAGGSGEAPKQFLQWVPSPDDSEYEQLKSSKTHLAPYETRAVNAGWVKEQINDAQVGPGSNLCANSESGAEVGGFWLDNNGRIYVRTN